MTTTLKGCRCRGHYKALLTNIICWMHCTIVNGASNTTPFSSDQAVVEQTGLDDILLRHSDTRRTTISLSNWNYWRLLSWNGCVLNSRDWGGWLVGGLGIRSVIAFTRSFLWSHSNRAESSKLDQGISLYVRLCFYRSTATRCKCSCSWSMRGHPY